MCAGGQEGRQEGRQEGSERVVMVLSNDKSRVMYWMIICKLKGIIIVKRGRGKESIF